MLTPQFILPLADELVIVPPAIAIAVDAGRVAA